MPKFFPTLGGLALGAVLLSGTACDPTEPSDLSGTYTATTFSLTRPGQATQNLLTAGATLTITITGNTSSSGSLFLPNSVTGTGDLTASMAGTVVRMGSAVSFTQTADTFVRDITFAFSGGTLVGTYNGGTEGVINLTLTRQ